MAEEGKRIDYNFLNGDQLADFQTADTEGLINLLNDRPYLAVGFLYQSWNVGHYDDLDAIGQNREGLFYDQSVRDEMFDKIIIGCIGDSDRSRMFSLFARETAESLIRGSIEYPIGPLNESQQQDVNTFHDEVMDVRNSTLLPAPQPLPSLHPVTPLYARTG